jgi:hypothetical protein
MKTTISFRDFILSDHAKSEFAAIAKHNRPLPNLKLWRQLRKYLNHRGADDVLMITARAAWQEYRRHLRGPLKKRGRKVKRHISQH